ncbi:digestive cysteine proteinase 2-like [Rhynchophorus ferrugineus]
MARTVIRAVMLFAVLNNSSVYTQLFPPNPINLDLNPITIAQQWMKFKRENGKMYNDLEEKLRFDIFTENIKKIVMHNQKYFNGLIHYHIGINQFSDLTKNEFVKNILKLNTPSGHSYRNKRSARQKRQALPEIDWRQRGAVTEVKNQKSCGSCWSFSAIGSLESQFFLKTGHLVSLSEQNLMDCAVDQTNRACSGGWMSNAYDYLKNHWVTSENIYPYRGQQQECQLLSNSYQVSIKDYYTIPPNEESLKQAVSNIGPISGAMDASNLQFYAGGVFRDDDCDTSGYVNHGILVVGYGNEAGRDYWLIKNSWGKEWGEGGYFKLIRNRNNECNIATYGMYPIL